MEQKKHEVNQVWNTDIDKEQNQRNSRIAMIVLGVSVALLIGLVAVAIGQISSMTANLPEISFEEFFAKREPQPEPERNASADEAFLRTAEDFVEEYYYACTEGGDVHQAQVVLKYAEAFKAYELRVKWDGLVVDSDFDDFNLQNYATMMNTAVSMMSDSVAEKQVTEDYQVMYIADRLQWTAGHVELAEVVRELLWYDGLLGHKSQIPLYFTKRLPYYTACVELEADLQNQLPVEPSIPGDAVYPYTNHTTYAMDIVFTNEYLTEEGILSDYVAFNNVEPGDTIEIPLANRPARAVVDQVVWTVQWDILTCYKDGADVME